MLMILLSLGVILLCSLHLGVGFFSGYRLGTATQRGDRRSPEAVPSYFPAVLELLERSQQLHLQTGASMQELPEKLVLALARLLESAESLNAQLPNQAAFKSEEGRRERLAERPQKRSFFSPPKTKGKRLSPCDIPRLSDPVPATSSTLSMDDSHSFRERSAGNDMESDDSPLVMTDMMNLVVKANREAEGGAKPDTRYPYPTQQFAAFYNVEMPSPEEFVPVQCIDVSASGISFLLDHRPTSDTLVITLGQKPQLTFMAAKVMNHRYMLANGEEGYRVGCLFLKRLDRNMYAWDQQNATIVSVTDSIHSEASTELVVSGAGLAC